MKQGNMKAMRHAYSRLFLVTLAGLFLAACGRSTPERKVDCNNLRLQRYDNNSDAIRSYITPLVLENYGKGCVLNDSIVVRLYHNFIDTASASFNELPYAVILDPAITDLHSWDELSTYAYRYELAKVVPRTYYDHGDTYDSAYSVEKLKVYIYVDTKMVNGEWPQRVNNYPPYDALPVSDSLKMLFKNYTDPEFY